MTQLCDSLLPRLELVVKLGVGNLEDVHVEVARLLLVVVGRRLHTPILCFKLLDLISLVQVRLLEVYLLDVTAIAHLVGDVALSVRGLHEVRAAVRKRLGLSLQVVPLCQNPALGV